MRKDYRMHTIYLGSRNGKPFLPADYSKIKDIILKEFGHFTMLEADGFFAGKDIKTIESLAPEGSLSTIQQAFVDTGAIQCGFCTPGMVMSAIDLVIKNPNPDETTIREQLEGNICRCTGYHNIVKAVQQAAKTMGG